MGGMKLGKAALGGRTTHPTLQGTELPRVLGQGSCPHHCPHGGSRPPHGPQCMWCNEGLCCTKSLINKPIPPAQLGSAFGLTL